MPSYHLHNFEQVNLKRMEPLLGGSTCGGKRREDLLLRFNNPHVNRWIQDTANFLDLCNKELQDQKDENASLQEALKTEKEMRAKEGETQRCALEIEKEKHNVAVLVLCTERDNTVKKMESDMEKERSKMQAEMKLMREELGRATSENLKLSARLNTMEEQVGKYNSFREFFQRVSVTSGLHLLPLNSLVPCLYFQIEDGGSSNSG